MVKHWSAGESRRLITRLRDNRTTLVTIALVMSLLAGGAAMARRTGSALRSGSTATQETPASLTPASPSKEYIYAGGRLIATEEPAGSTCNFVIAPTSQSFPSGGGSGSVAVTAGAGCGWTASSNAAWITINSGTTGSGNGSVGFSVAANSAAARNGTMTIAGQTFTVNQAAAGCSYSISPTSQAFAASGGSGSVAVTAGAGCGWTATSNAAWITVTSGSSGSGNGSVGYFVAANSGAARNGTMTIAGQTFTVSQAAAGCSYSISPTSQAFAASGGSGSVAVTAGAGCGWTANSNAAWITVTSGSSGSGNGSVGYSVAANTGAARNGTITIAGQTFTVSQGAASCSYSISPTSQAFAASGGTGSVAVTAGAGCGWTANSNAAWITVTSGTPGSGNGSVGYSVAANTGATRNGTVTIAGQTFTVSQAAASGGTEPTLSNMSPATAIQGASFTLTINGSNLAGATSVNFSPPEGVTISNISSTASQVTCSVSIGAAAAVSARFVTVTTASGGTSTNSLIFGISSSSPAPVIGSISPSKKARGTTFTLTINGGNLSQATSVNFSPSEGITANIVIVSASQVAATVTISAGAATGIRQVSVTTPFGTSNTKSFTVQ